MFQGCHCASSIAIFARKVNLNYAYSPFKQTNYSYCPFIQANYAYSPFKQTNYAYSPFKQTKYAYSPLNKQIMLTVPLTNPYAEYPPFPLYSLTSSLPFS